jgi:hypothetical protein
LAKKEKLKVLPVLNKIDAICEIPVMEKEIRIELEMPDI